MLGFLAMWAPQCYILPPYRTLLPEKEAMGGFSIPDSQSLAYHHSGFQNFTERDSVDKERVHAVAQKALLEQVSLALEHGGASELLTLLRSVADPSFRFDRCFEQITTKEQVRELFELVHFDSLAGDGPAGFVRSSHTLAVASQLLSFFARRHDLNEKQRAELDRLQRGFLFASNLQQYSSYSPDQTVMAHRLKAYKTAVLQELAEKGEVVLAAGWKGSPGHFVLMELHCREGRVSGSITNSGSGVDFHLLARVEGHKIKQGNTLYLKETSLDALSSSPFLHLVWNLWTFHELSNSKEDFYHTVLCHWPGDIKLGDSYGIYHSKQSGPTCTFRPLQQVAKDILGPVLGRLYKLYVQIATLLPRLSILGEQPTLQEIDQLIYATSQIARRVYRMATAGLLPGSQERGLMELCKSIRQSLLDRRSEYLDQVRFRRCSLKMLASDLEPIEKEPPAPMIQSAPAFEWPSLRLEQTRDAFMENAKNVQALSAQQNQQDAADLAIETLLNLPPQVLQEPTEEEFEALLFLFEAEYLQIQGDAGAPRLSVRRGLALLMGFVASLNYCAQQPNGASFAGFHRYLLNLHLSQGNQLRRMKHPKDLAVYERLMSELKRVPYEEGMATTIVRYTNPGMLVFKWLGSDLGKLLQKQGELASMNALADLNAFGFGMQSLPIWYKLVVYQGYLLYALCFARLKQLFKLGPLKVGQNLSQAGSQAIFTTEIYGSFLGYGKGAETSLSILDEGSDVKFLNSESIQKARCAHSFNFHSDVLSGVGGCEGMKGMTEAQTEEFSLISMDPALLVPRWAQFVERYPMLLNSRVPCYHIEATLFVPHFGEYPIDDLSQAPLFHDAIARVLKVCQNERWKDAALALVRMQ
ncbi:MAG: hypothetical protein KDK78_00670, partial [Chlamydiia bacterium]|nr:hypothetical protein [Chlamydiia bacterium]